MLKLSHTKLIAISGVVWFCAGVSLLRLGLKFLVGEGIPEDSYRPMITGVAPLFGGAEQASVVVIAAALVIGYFKGRYALGKSVQRVVTRIRTLPNPSSIHKMYSLPYFILLSSMVGIGMLIKYFNVPLDIRGVIDVIIGSALINGASLYFKHAFLMRRSEVTCDI